MTNFQIHGKTKSPVIRLNFRQTAISILEVFLVNRTFIDTFVNQIVVAEDDGNDDEEENCHHQIDPYPVSQEDHK